MQSAHPAIDLNDATLGAWPLPMPAENGDKEERGRVLVVAGSREIPGAALLAGTAALRAGAGKLVIGTPAAIASNVALAIPEARVVALAENHAGQIDPHTCTALQGRYGAVLVGPGMQHPQQVTQFVCGLLACIDDAPIVLDACAMDVLCGPNAPIQAFNRPVLLTPHAGELAHLSGYSKAEVQAAPERLSLALAHKWNAYIALKGATTYIAAPNGKLWRHEGGNVGLATSGSGDALAGLIIGLAARGASLEQACAWGVALHARAGDRLAERFGPLGYLAREIADEVPRLMHTLGVSPKL